MFEHLTRAARLTVVHAQEEARQLGHRQIGITTAALRAALEQARTGS